MLSIAIFFFFLTEENYQKKCTKNTNKKNAFENSNSPMGWKKSIKLIKFLKILNMSETEFLNESTRFRGRQSSIKS